MNDDERLRGYRPAGPPPDLRARILHAGRATAQRCAKGQRRAKALAERSSPERSRRCDWLPAVAAAVLIVLFGVLSYRLQADIDAKLTVPDDRQAVEQWIPPDMEGLR